MSKKGAKMSTKEQSYEFRDVVLAKVRGYPPWPGMVVDPETIPEQVQKERPNAKTKKGTWYCVRFFPAGDYAWIVPKDISKLQQHEIEAYISEPYKRSGELLKGYHIAADPAKWEEEIEAARAEAAEEEANAEIDQLQSDGEEEGDDEEDKSTKSKKRKRDSDAGITKSKSKPKAKKGSAEPASKKRAGSTTKSKKNGAKPRTSMVESEDEGGMGGDDEDAGPSKQASPPPAKKAKRDKDEDDGDAALASDPEALKVRDWRHKLQKAFLNVKQVPKADDMPALETLFSTVENYDNMNIQYLSFSKIGKVMRHIHALTPDKVPRDEEFQFRDRAKTLVDKWHDIINAKKPNGAGADEAAKASALATNGTSNGAKSEDAAVSANGKEDSEGPAKANGEDHAHMDVDADADAKAEELDAADHEVPAVDAKDPAAAHTTTSEDVSGENADADASVLADITMSEVAA